MTRVSEAAAADLLVIGCGPTGATLAGLAARQGLRVVVVEREGDISTLPRAVHCDHEVLRILQELGCAEEILATSIINEGLDFLNAERQILLSFTPPRMGRTGWPSSIFFHQPTFESILRWTVRGLGVDLRTGVEAVAIEQDDDGVSVTLAGGEVVRARYVVGCDGARSMTRRVIDSAMTDTGFEEAWLVIDLIVDRKAPSVTSRCLQVCDPGRPHTVVPMPAPRLRFEFMLLPSDNNEDLGDPEVIDGLLVRWIDPALVEIERAAVYTFHGLVASSWRDRRVLLAGDAAHQTPPFLGQGMCAGMRDAANLAWKIASVLGQGASETLLDSYQAERQPHAQAVIDLAVGFGKMICLTDPAQAAERDALFLSRRGDPSEELDAMPPLEVGSAIGRGGGALSRQPWVRGVRLDELVGPRFALITAQPLDPSSSASQWWTSHGAVFDAVAYPEIAVLLEGDPACAIRPDRYVLARGEVDEVTAIAARLFETATAEVAADSSANPIPSGGA